LRHNSIAARPVTVARSVALRHCHGQASNHQAVEKSTALPMLAIVERAAAGFSQKIATRQKTPRAARPPILDSLPRLRLWPEALKRRLD